MCGRYYLEISKDELSHVSNIEEFEFEPNFNIAPQSKVPAIINNNLTMTTWGYFPDWLKSQANSRPLFNTRFESVQEKKTFQSAFKNNRCIIPISGWYEWKRDGENKTPYYFSNNSTMFAAGLFWTRSSGEIETSIITREASSNLNVVHNRSPLILNDDELAIWNSDIDSGEIYDGVNNYDYDKVTYHEVDKAVNNPRNNNESLIKEYTETPF
jgi:putative SOS response-associated peptidase YedK